ncbi:MAG: RNA 2',3'-cyclic phosphodiesterase [Anaerolineae bacterium]|nr:RNA 2',3'-cyclic phosphodiesterase [Anaerolineae bacterium]
MPRLFVAIDLPDPVKDDLTELCYGIRGVRWVKREQLHLTLRFIGDVEDDLLDTLSDALGQVRAAPFSFQLQGVGQFPPRGAPRIIWTGVKAPPDLKRLHGQIESVLQPLGIDPEDRPFSPHITLARLKEAPASESLRQFFGRHVHFKSAPIPVSRFVLYSSLLAPEGPTYTVEGQFALT